MLTYEKRKGLGIPLAIADTSAVRQKLVWRQDENWQIRAESFSVFHNCVTKEVAYKPLENLEISKTDVETEKETWSITTSALPII